MNMQTQFGSGWLGIMGQSKEAKQKILRQAWKRKHGFRMPSRRKSNPFVIMDGPKVDNFDYTSEPESLVKGLTRWILSPGAPGSHRMSRGI